MSYPFSTINFFILLCLRCHAVSFCSYLFLFITHGASDLPSDEAALNEQSVQQADPLQQLPIVGDQAGEHGVGRN